MANLIGNPGFEGGDSWSQCGRVPASLTKFKAHSGRYSAFAGTLTGSEINGDSGVCQAVTIPASGVLSFWVYRGSNEPSIRYARQWGLLIDAHGNGVSLLYSTISNSAGWKHLAYSVAPFAGRKLFVYFGVHGDGHKGHHTYQFVDDVSLTGTAIAPPPRPTPSSPIGVPAPVPTATPIATPTAMPGMGPGTPIAGPLSGPDGGYGPFATARGYDLPVQHGYDGSGRAVGVVMWGNVLGSDLAA